MSWLSFARNSREKHGRNNLHKPLDPDQSIPYTMSKSIEAGDSQMKLIEAETLIKQWRKCKDRISTINSLEFFARDNTARVECGVTTLELTPLETKMLMNILHNTIYEREQNLRERIVNELHIDVEV
jgi:hypothetical protein